MESQMNSSVYFQGLLLQASLIFALGAQNIFVLESGLKRRNHKLVALVCTLCDLSLVLLGVLGAATVFVAFPILKVLFGVLGVAFLAYYGFLKLRERPGKMDLTGSEGERGDRSRAALQALGFSLLNPHVYLDTVILIGGFSSRFSALSTRLSFGLGAASFSAIWFFVLAIGASQMRPLLADPRRMRVVTLGAGLILVALSVKMGGEVFAWARALKSEI